MIRFDEIEARKDDLRLQFLLAKPFPHLAIDGFCDEAELTALLDEMPEIATKSRDYVFAANKFERSRFQDLSPRYAALHADLISARFRDLLRYICHEEVFVDTAFHGGGIHQGKRDSFLNMHLDFNTTRCIRAGTGRSIYCYT